MAISLPQIVLQYRNTLDVIANATRGAFRLLRSPRRQLCLFQLFLSPTLRGIWLTRPRIVFKHLHKYLYLNCRSNDCLTALLYHYEFLLNRVHPQFFSKLAHFPPTLWAHEVSSKEVSINLIFPAPDDQEGDLALVIKVGAQRVFILSFSIVPSICFDEHEGPAIFVCRVQGLTGSENIRNACRLCDEVDPGAMLMAALTGFARSLDINRIYGVTTAAQLSCGSGNTLGRRMVFDYDSFWRQMHARCYSQQYFLLDCPIFRRPLNSIASKHRKRSLLKRNLKDIVAAEVVRSMSQQVLR